MNFSIIQKSQLEGVHRLDAEYYQPEYLKLDKKIDTYGSQLKTFGELLDKGNSLTGGATPLGADYSSEGIKFLRVQNIMPGYFDFSDIVFIDKKIHDGSLKRSRLLDDDVLLTITGVSYGKANVYKKIFGEANINQHSVRMHFIPSLVPEYVCAFLNSKYGHFQSDRKITGNSRPALAYEEIKTYKIPLLPLKYQNKIKEIYLESLNKENESIELYNKTEELLLEELGLSNFKPREDLSFIINLSEVEESNRADSDSFQPKYRDLIKRLIKTTSLSSIAKRKTNLVKINPSTEYSYIEISDINAGTGESTYNKVLGKDLPANAKLKITGGELLVSKVRPTRGAISIIPDDWNENFVASGAFSIFEVSSPYKEFLQIVLKSIIGKLQLEKPMTGTSYPTVTDEDVQNILIPETSIRIREEIAELVKKSHEARKKSKELLEEAKRKVEEMIEKASKN